MLLSKFRIGLFLLGTCFLALIQTGCKHTRKHSGFTSLSDISFAGDMPEERRLAITRILEELWAQPADMPSVHTCTAGALFEWVMNHQELLSSVEGEEIEEIPITLESPPVCIGQLMDRMHDEHGLVLSVDNRGCVSLARALK